MRKDLSSPAMLPFSLLSLLLFFAFSTILCPSGFAADLVQANTALQQGKVDEATASLKSILAGAPNDAAAHLLLCRTYYAQDLADQAIRECELAVANSPDGSLNHLWLGRAYGLKASHGNPFNALGLAKKVRDEFERAAQLDPKAPRAASDLCQFYINAPGMVGGGADKARAVINRIEPAFPAYSHRLRALLADKGGDLTTAEAEFKKVIGVENNPAAWIDLADFYQRHKRDDDASAAVQSALALNPKNAVLVDAASILTAAHRSQEVAERVLREYLVSSAKSDEAPAFKVHLQLGKLLATRGDASGARSEYLAATALASTYAPAVKALRGA
jgi:tetratricopeptide (TPR) repeat protein